MNFLKILGFAKKAAETFSEVIEYIENNKEIIQTVIDYAKNTGKKIKDLISDETLVNETVGATDGTVADEVSQVSEKCSVCGGTGSLSFKKGTELIVKVCPECHGTGEMVKRNA